MNLLAILAILIPSVSLAHAPIPFQPRTTRRMETSVSRALLPEEWVRRLADELREDDPGVRIEGTEVTPLGTLGASVRFLGMDYEARANGILRIHQRIVSLSSEKGRWEVRGQTDTTLRGESRDLLYRSDSELMPTEADAPTIRVRKRTQLLLSDHGLPWRAVWAGTYAASLPELLDTVTRSPGQFVVCGQETIEIGIDEEVFRYPDGDFTLQDALRDALGRTAVPVPAAVRGCINDCFGAITTPLSWADLLCVGLGAAACGAAGPGWAACFGAVLQGCGIAATLGEVAALAACVIKCL